MSAPDFKRIAVLDIGKTNAKVVVLDVASGTEIATRKTPNRVLTDPPYPHYDIEHLWGFLLSALTDFAAEPGFDAISITTHGASAVLLRTDGTLALPVIDYEYEYSSEICDAYAAIRPPFAETFSPKLPGGLNVGAQIHYQQTAFPEAFAKVATILTYPQYWAFRLTGVAANEVTSLGCHTDLWRPAEGKYSSLVDTLGIRSLMAPVRSAFDALGLLLPGLAARAKLGKPVPVYCGIHDSNASLLPHLVSREAPFAVISTGTWVVCFAVGADTVSLDPKRDTLANVDAFGRAVPSARFMGGREFEMLTQGLEEVSSADVEAATARVVEKSVLLLPNVTQGSGPYPGREMAWIGKVDDNAERFAAASLYVGMMAASCLTLIGADGPTIVEGPFSSNDVCLQALAAATGRPVIVLSGAAPTGTAQGASLLTGISAPAGVERHFVPEPDLARYHERWRQALSG